MQEAKALVRSCVHAGSLEPSPHADVIRTIILCADQFIVLFFNCGPLFYFIIQYYYNLNSIVRGHKSRQVSLLVIQINSRCLFLIMGSKLLQVRLAPIVKLNYAYSKVFFHWFLNMTMAEFEYVLRAERKDDSDGKTMFGLFLLVRTSILNQWTYDRKPV